MYGASNNTYRPPSRHGSYGAHRLSNQLPNAIQLRTPNMNDSDAVSTGSGNNPVDGGETTAEEDIRYAQLRERYLLSQARLSSVLGDEPAVTGDLEESQNKVTSVDDDDNNNAPASQQPTVTKKPARAIDEDDYGDDDEDEEDDDATASPLQSRSGPLPTVGASAITAPNLSLQPYFQKNTLERVSTQSTDQGKSSDDVRKMLEEDKKAAEDAAKRSFNTIFYTLENDRDAMLEQQKLDELDRQVESETSAQGNSGSAPGQPQQGSLSTSNLGASSLTLKHLIARIDAKRDKVNATDAQLRSLISEVRKNRSKWANEDRVGQEELYDALEKVLMELKAQEHAHPFLQRVNKREAPDYYQVIKHPMDIGTMMKKLKQLQYKSKKEFVDDLMLIWSNCLKYNADPAHFLRKKALYMKKETEKLVPLIPDIVVRDRAEVEAEERRVRQSEMEVDGGEDSDDEEPIMASRGRKAPSKGSKGTTTARKAPPSGIESTPGAEAKPPVPTLGSSVTHLKNEFARADSDAPMEGSLNGFTTPPPGTLTPLGPNGTLNSGALGSQIDPSEADASSTMVAPEDADVEDLEYKTWKQVTKKDRAIIAAERHRLFRGDQLNVDEPAILRTKAGMRRWMRHQKQSQEGESTEDADATGEGEDGAGKTAGETLAEGMEGDQERQLPDYYDPVCAIPELPDRLKWVEDSNGNLIDQAEEFLRVVPQGQFVSPESSLTKKMEANMRQMQETRKVCARIGIVRQMQLQSQMYQNQFQKYEPTPLVEQDVDPMVVSDDGPIMARHVIRAALQRSVGKIFYHSGFEEFQPSALEAVTDIASSFFTKLTQTLCVYRDAPKVKADPVPGSTEPQWKPRFTQEECVLHCLHENGVDIESIETYIKDDVDRLNTKLGGMHERMKAHLAELLRPALDGSVGADGVGAFNDGSEQFVGGDFAEDIGEDFFGFKELGLDREFGLESLSVPLHLLQNRMHNVYQAQNTASISATGIVLEQPPPFEPVTIENIVNEIGLVQDFFLQKLHKNNDQPLIEDEDLPVKQRFPKPRLPPTGKISSPRKRPLREQQQMARKKRRMEEGKDVDGGGGGGGNGENAAGGGGAGAVRLPKPIGKLKLEMPSSNKDSASADPEKEENGGVGMMSPESITA